jgi:hypothetical protein
MSAIDKFGRSGRSRAGGPHHLELATPSDTTDLPFVTQWIFVAGAGSLHLTMASGAEVTTPQLPAGWHLIEVRRIHATGTTATGLMVGY